MTRLLAMLLVTLLPAGLCLSARGKADQPLRIGVVQSLFRYATEAEAKASMGRFETFMMNRTGLGGEFQKVNDPFDLAEQVDKEKLHLATFHGIEFAWVKQKYPKLVPLVIAVNQGHQLRAHVIVAKDSDVKDFAGLKGKSLAFPKGTREHCRIFIDGLCNKQGDDIDKFFSQIVRPENMEDALDDVVDGMVQAVLVDDVALDNYRERKAARFARLKQIEKSDAFPAGTVVYREGGLNEETLDKVKKALLTANDSAEGKQILFNWKLTAFERVPRDYGKLVDDIAKVYPAKKMTR